MKERKPGDPLRVYQIPRIKPEPGSNNRWDYSWLASNHVIREGIVHPTCGKTFDFNEAKLVMSEYENHVEYDVLCPRCGGTHVLYVFPVKEAEKMIDEKKKAKPIYRPSRGIE